MRSIKAIIVDDEPLARERIASLLLNEPDIEVVAECKDGYEAVKILSKIDIDLVFLDIQMPKIDGFATLKEINPKRLPLIIFTTAYEEFALKAFDINAVDYLLKPFDRKRFRNALDRVRERIDSKEYYSTQLLKLLQNLSEKKDYPERITIKSEDKIIFLPIDDIEWLESDANYLKLFTKGKTFSIRETINSFLSKVNPKYFIRIHRSTVVNFNYVKELQPWFNDNYIVILKDGTKLSVGRTYRRNISSLFPS